MRRFTVFVSEEELNALKAVADKELRDYRIQARLLIKSELENRGLLGSDKVKVKSEARGAINGQSSR